MSTEPSCLCNGVYLSLICRVNCNNDTFLMYHNVIARKVKVLALLDKLDSSISLPGVPDSTGNKTKQKPAYSCVCHASISIYISMELNIPPLFCIQQKRWLLSVATVRSFIIVDTVKPVRNQLDLSERRTQ